MIQREVWYVIGGNPDNSGGGIIDTSYFRFEADRLAAHYVSLGYRGVRVVSHDEFMDADSSVICGDSPR